MMEKDSLRTNNNGNNTNYSREKTVGDGGLLRSSSDPAKQAAAAAAADFGLHWGNRKRLRCMKIQVKDVQSGPVNRTTVRVDRRVVRADKDSSNQPNNNSNHGNGYFNLRQPPAFPQPPPPQRVLSCALSNWSGGRPVHDSGELLVSLSVYEGAFNVWAPSAWFRRTLGEFMKASSMYA